MMQMSDKLDKHKIQELREMVKQKNRRFCRKSPMFLSRAPLPHYGHMPYYYNVFVKDGDIKENDFSFNVNFS
jgi:hypothetical protein